MELGLKVDPDHDRIEVDRKPAAPPKALRYVVFHKPTGVVTSSKGQGAPTIYDILPLQLPYVGRLDKDTSGLIILTNDGELSFRLTHPRFKVQKTYLATLKVSPQQNQVNVLKNGMMLEDGFASASYVRLLCHSPKRPQVEITVLEGRKRLVRRMFAFARMELLELVRIRFGPLTLDLSPGKFRDLTEKEVDSLKKAAGIDD